MRRVESSIENEWRCQQLFLTFMQCLDAGDADGAVALVAADIVWHRQGQKLVGPTAIRNVIAERPGNRVIRHHLSNIVVTLESPDRAGSKAYYSVYVHEGSAKPGRIDGPERVGDYYAQYLKTSDGWRIALLRADRIFAAAGKT